MLKSVALACSFILSSGQTFQIEVPKTVGPAKTPVIFLSQKHKVIEVSRSETQIHAKAILRWGVHVYEVGQLVFACKRGRCKAVDFVSQALYEKCVVKGQKARCFNRLTASPEQGGSDPDQSMGPDDTRDNEDPENDDLNEWPGRGDDREEPRP